MQMLSNANPSPRIAARRLLAGMRLAVLAGLLAIPLMAAAETVALEGGVSIDFPAAPKPLEAPHKGFELIRRADEASPAHGYRIEKLDLPAWVGWMMRKAPDAAAEMLEGRVSSGVLESLPGAEITSETPITVNGFAGAELRIENITANRENPLKKNFSQFRGRFLLIDGGLYLYGVSDSAADPAHDEDVSVFLDSLQIAHEHIPGDPGQQLQIVGYWILGALLLALLLFVAFVIAVVVLVKRLRRRGKQA